MNTFDLEIVTPIRIYDMSEVSYLRCPGADGLFGIMAGHTKSLFALTIGELKVTQHNENEYFATGGGYIEVRADKVQLLLESVEKAREIDTGRAEESLNRAKERLRKKEQQLDPVRARASIARAINRLHVANK